MDQIADVVVSDAFTKRNFGHRARFAGGELFEPNGCACDRLYDDGVSRPGILIFEDELAGSATGRRRNGHLQRYDVTLSVVLELLDDCVCQYRQQPVSLDGDA